jgi:hypothetical protein
MSNMKSTPTPVLPSQLDSQLNRHFLACSAFVGTAVLMATSKADASVVYSGLLNINVPTTNGTGGIYFDLTLPGSSFIPTKGGGGATEGLSTLLPGWDVNFYKSGTGNLRWYYNGGALAVFNGANHVAALGAGVEIDGSASLGTFQTMVPEFTGTTAFMGLEFFDAGNARFGWIRISGGPTAGFPATIVDWAYENSGAGILTGAGIIPEPSSLALGCLAAGAAGLAAWRKRKAA